MTRRAERLAEFLTNAGWTVFDTDTTNLCKKCGYPVINGKFCQECGTKAHSSEKSEEEKTYEFLETAIKYALKKDKPTEKKGWEEAREYCS